MELVWNFDGVAISSVTTNKWNDGQLWTTGVSSYQGVVMLQWEATALDAGWLVRVTKPTGLAGEYQGTTFNLPLEIATAVKRLY